jgi:2-isopropylmalate synthase
MPRRLQVEFSGEVQHYTDQHGGEMEAADIWALFSRTYLETASPVSYVEHHLFEEGKGQGIRLTVQKNGEKHVLTGEGNGPIDASVHALSKIGITLQVRSYEERSMGKGGDAKACAFMEVTQNGSERECYGVGMDANIVTASIKALMSGVNRVSVSVEAAKAA